MTKFFSLLKEESKLNISAIDIPPYIKIDEDEKRRLYLKIHNKDVLKFYDTILEEKTNFDFSYMHNNIVRLKISPIFTKSSKFLGRKTAGYYNCRKNRIKYTKKLKNKILPHELMHMASTVRRKKDNSIFSGFSQLTSLNNYKSIGRAFNEGYTQLLVERYFNVDYKAYTLEKIVTSKIEDILGKDNMERMYFKADLKGLLVELLKYEDETSIMFFLHCLDYLETIYCKNNIDEELSKLRKIYCFVLMFLIDIKIKQISETETDFEAARKNLSDYTKNIAYNIIINSNDKKISLVNSYDIKKINYEYLRKLENLYKNKAK